MGLFFNPGGKHGIYQSTTGQKERKEKKIKEKTKIHRSNVQEACTTSKVYKQQQFVITRAESTNKCGTYKNIYK
jgi:hypothetical protein